MNDPEAIKAKIDAYNRALTDARYQRRNGRCTEECEVGLELEKHIESKIKELTAQIPEGEAVETTNEK